eukprot:9507412-Ditylum_brightwellii.AAC.1
MLKSTSDKWQYSSTYQSRKEKKPDRIQHSVPTMPVIRSLRNRNVPLLKPMNNAEQGKEVLDSQTAMEQKEEEETELFQDSMLVQYLIQDASR